MAIICQSCEHENDEGRILCDNCGKELAVNLKNEFSTPVKMLKEISNRIMERPMAYNQEKLEEVFSHVMEISHDLLDKVQVTLEDSLIELDRLPLNELKQLSKEVENVEHMDIFTDFVSNFELAQEQIDEGLALAKDSFMAMRNFSDLEIGKVGLEKASEMMEQGLDTLELITANAEEKTFLQEKMEPIPSQVIVAMDGIEKVMLGLSKYLDTRDTELLIESLPFLDLIKENLQKAIELSPRVKDEEEEEEDEEDELANLKKGLSESSGIF